MDIFTLLVMDLDLAGWVEQCPAESSLGPRSSQFAVEYR
jgi:hypothetical protein